MLKRIKNYVENVVLCVKVGYNIGARPNECLTVPVDKLNETTKYGYPIIHSNELVRKDNGVIAAILPFYATNLFGMQIGEPTYAIVVDDFFYKLSETSKEFVLYHEVGHMVHNHMDGLDGKDYMSKRKNTTKYASIEIEADTYAAERIGYANAYHALTEIFEFIRIINTPEDKARLNSMKSYLEKGKRDYISRLKKDVWYA